MLGWIRGQTPVQAHNIFYLWLANAMLANLHLYALTIVNALSSSR
ncbi:hypothetical protein MADA3029_1220025 [Vibrio nigripulchritudo MADA3029]|nr:hypothetical protein VIBNIMADA3020_800025 [Vibrio nigripulchritudo MADA3020]CCN55320.1 hypothetical protein VIBNIMADA3021_740040 [Vibrio nigripulchritudo MADA3021]CCN57973.1 hypothetical protein MADA3029_1220025 [Vibrio nigripulchritudo MADA3029]